MSPVNYIEVISSYYQSKGFPPYQWSKHDTSPWTPLTRPENKSLLSVVCSGGVYHKDDDPVPWAVDGSNDLRWRLLPRDVDARELRIVHGGYNHADADRDVNCILPIDRLRELEAEGYIGGLAPYFFSYRARIFGRSRLMQEWIPALIKRLKEVGTDLGLLIPV